MNKIISFFLLAIMFLLPRVSFAETEKTQQISHVYKCGGNYTVSFRATDNSSDVVLLKDDTIVSRRNPQQVGAESLDNRYITNVSLTDLDGLQGLSDEAMVKKLLSRDQYTFIGEGDFNNPGTWKWGLKINHQMQVNIIPCSKAK